MGNISSHRPNRNAVASAGTMQQEASAKMSSSHNVNQAPAKSEGKDNRDGRKNITVEGGITGALTDGTSKQNLN